MANFRNGAVPAPQPPDSYPENGRFYHSWRRGQYMYPCDEDEQDRMDMTYKLFEIARRGQLHAAPIIQNPYDPPRIMDLGCGTGIWAIDVADMYPQAEVLGLDLSNIQPRSIPANVRFRVPADYESHWTLGADSWDLIRLSMACGSVGNWPALYQKIHQHLKPGQGFIEHVEIDYEPRCDDGTLDPNSALTKWYNLVADATDEAQRPLAYQHNTRQMLQQAGFIDIQETVIRVPYNQWPSDPHQKTLGMWHSIIITAGIEALSLGSLWRVKQMDLPQIHNLCREVKAEVCMNRIHAYNNIHIWTARRPV